MLSRDNDSSIVVVVVIFNIANDDFSEGRFPIPKPKSIHSGHHERFSHAATVAVFLHQRRKDREGQDAASHFMQEPASSRSHVRNVQKIVRKLLDSSEGGENFQQTSVNILRDDEKANFSTVLRNPTCGTKTNR